MKGYLLGKTEVGGKSYAYNDMTGITGTGFGSDYYGGRVKSFGTTKEGFLLCIERDKVIDIFVDEDRLTAEGRELLGLEALPFEPEGETDITKMERKELLALAKKLEIEGKLATLKTADLIAAIQEKRETE